MFKVVLKPILFLGAFLALALSAWGCGNPCNDLAGKVCDCQPTRAKQKSCEISVDSASQNISLSDEEKDRCSEILDAETCTCDALAAGDYASCGLSEDAYLTLTEGGSTP
jgi:hypothetical protein